MKIDDKESCGHVKHIDSVFEKIIFLLGINLTVKALTAYYLFVCRLYMYLLLWFVCLIVFI